jgi:hypothetical protein
MMVRAALNLIVSNLETGTGLNKCLNHAAADEDR